MACRCPRLQGQCCCVSSLSCCLRSRCCLLQVVPSNQQRCHPTDCPLLPAAARARGCGCTPRPSLMLSIPNHEPPAAGADVHGPSVDTAGQKGGNTAADSSISAAGLEAYVRIMCTWAVKCMHQRKTRPWHGGMQLLLMRTCVIHNTPCTYGSACMPSPQLTPRCCSGCLHGHRCLPLVVDSACAAA
jgi:hypothetical protein